MGSAAALGLASAAYAGPVIIDGTDANDHGGTSGGANVTGWLYMQKALENLAGQVGNGNKIVVDLGTSGSTAGAAIASAFNLSSLPGAGWTLVNVDGAANIGSYLGGGTVNGASTANTGILYIPSANNSNGDLTGAELTEINNNAASIATFVGGAGNPATGGGLFAMGESGPGAYGWLSTLIPGIVVTDIGGGGFGTDITLTPDGVTAFPGLTNADLSGADPWHNYFGGNLGSLKVLGVADFNGSEAIILGGGAGTVIQPNPLPETMSLFGALPVLAGLIFMARRKN